MNDWDDDDDPTDWSDTDDFDDDDYEDFLRRESLDGSSGSIAGGHGLSPVWKWTAWTILFAVIVGWVLSSFLGFLA